MGRMQGPGGGPRGFLTEEEKKSSPKVTWPLIKRIMSYLKPYILQLVLVLLAIVISAAVGLLPSIITGRIVDEALIGRDMGLLIKLIAAALGTLLASQLISLLESYINSWISQRIIYDMKNQMYSHLQHMPQSFFDSEKQGDIITRMNSDIGGVSSVISGTLTNSISNITVVITTLVALFLMNWQLAIVGVLVVPLLIIPTRSAGNTRWKLLYQSQQKTDELNQIVNETLSVSGSLLVKLFSKEKEEYAHFEKVNGEVTKLALKEARSGKWFRLSMGLMTQLAPLLIYFAGGYFIIKMSDATLTVGTVTATVALVNRLYRPVEQLLNLQVDFTRSLALFTRIFDYFDRDAAITNKPKAGRPRVANSDIVFKDVDFSYGRDSQVLFGVSFTVPAKTTVAVVGPSGSGKSTLVNLIPRLYDVNAGSVKIGGIDVRDFDMYYLRRCIGMVSQDTYLFNGTIRENLLYARPDATEEELIHACESAGLGEFLAEQPAGLDTVVGNRGLMLSGGEKQRVSIARVMLKKPDIVILDEATSALDSITESLITNAAEGLMQGRTSLVIAHRLSTILAADSIIVIDDGRIVEQGTHEQLLEHDGIYKELYETQFGKKEDAEDD